MDFKEFSAKNVEDAITKACEEYVVPTEKLEYEIIEEGSNGFLGIGAKPAVIKARIKSEAPSEKKVEKSEKKAEKKVEKAAEKNEKKAEKAADKAEKADKKAEKAVEKNEKSEEKADKVSEKISDTSEKREKRLPVNVDEKAVIANAEAFLKDVFAAMNLNVNIKSEYFTKDAEIIIELSGDEMGVLIGKRGQTLDSLQYLTSLVVNKGVNGYIRVKVDTEDYRRRRKETLENLAKNLSHKVKRTRKSVSLEPMNPYERRVIHSALQGDRYVNTHSEGDEPFRRVVITPKKNDRY